MRVLVDRDQQLGGCDQVPTNRGQSTVSIEQTGVRVLFRKVYSDPCFLSAWAGRGAAIIAMMPTSDANITPAVLIRRFIARL